MLGTQNTSLLEYYKRRKCCNAEMLKCKNARWCIPKYKFKNDKTLKYIKRAKIPNANMLQRWSVKALAC